MTTASSAKSSSAYSQILNNRLKTWLIMFLFAFFITFLVFIFTNALGFEGPTALGFTGMALIITGIMNLGSYYYSDKIVMAISQAKQIEKKDAPELFRIVENLSIAQGTPMPKVYIINDSAINAFATGRDPKHAAIAVTTGILERLERLELEGVIAHELSHIKNYDTRLLTIVSILVGMIAMLADLFIRMTWFGSRGNDKDRSGGAAIFMLIAIVLAIISPIIGMLIQLAISRKREFLADASGALLTRNPDGLASALLKISEDKEPLEVANKATAHLYIANPLKGQPGVSWFAKLFSTHPPIEERVKVLQAM
jgi:heat shock protein HtpX